MKLLLVVLAVGSAAGKSFSECAGSARFTGGMIQDASFGSKDKAKTKCKKDAYCVGFVKTASGRFQLYNGEASPISGSGTAYVKNQSGGRCPSGESRSSRSSSSNNVANLMTATGMVDSMTGVLFGADTKTAVLADIMGGNRAPRGTDGNMMTDGFEAAMMMSQLGNSRSRSGGDDIMGNVVKYGVISGALGGDSGFNNGRSGGSMMDNGLGQALMINSVVGSGGDSDDGLGSVVALAAMSGAIGGDGDSSGLGQALAYSALAGDDGSDDTFQDIALVGMMTGNSLFGGKNREPEEPKQVFANGVLCTQGTRIVRFASGNTATVCNNMPTITPATTQFNTRFNTPATTQFNTRPIRQPVTTQFNAQRKKPNKPKRKCAKGLKPKAVQCRRKQMRARKAAQARKAAGNRVAGRA